MNIIFRHLRQVIVDHMGHMIDVDSAGGNVGGHKDPGFLGPEIIKRPIALPLGASAVNPASVDSVACKVLRQTIHSSLSSPENQDRALAGVDFVQNGSIFLGLDDVLGGLLDRGNRARDGPDADPGRVF